VKFAYFPVAKVLLFANKSLL